jgi:hypothetical protein
MVVAVSGTASGSKWHGIHEIFTVDMVLCVVCPLVCRFTGLIFYYQLRVCLPAAFITEPPVQATAAAAARVIIQTRTKTYQERQRLRKGNGESKHELLH